MIDPSASHPTGSRKGGTKVGPYLIEKVIGHGGMGTVYRVRHEETGAHAALKVMHADLFGEAAERAFERFRREAAVLKGIEPHPNIVGVQTFGSDAGVAWIAMEHVTGQPLSSSLKEGPLPIREGVELIETLARAVHHLHRHRVIHRDLKPENVVVTEEGDPRLVDFGLAHMSYASRLTMTGEVVGTPGYMAPEQVSGTSTAGDGLAEFGPQTDVYGLGSLLYAVLTGRSPFEGSDARSVMVDVVTVEAVAPSKVDPRVPAALDAVCLKALAKDPMARYPSARALGADLHRWLKGDSIEATIPGRMTRIVRGFQGPQNSVKRLVLMLVATVALSATVVALVVGGQRLVQGRTASFDVAAELEAELEAEGALAGITGAELADLVERAREVDPDLGRRFRIVTELQAAAARGSAPIETDDVMPLAELVRPDGVIDEPRLRLAESVLHRAGSHRALHVVLHGVAPIAAARPETAVDLARAIDASHGRLSPPIDDDAFEALYDARGLDDGLRGRLLAARAVASAAAGAAPAVTLDALERALLEHDVLSEDIAWSDPLRAELRARISPILATPGVDDADLDRARVLLALSVLSDLETTELPLADAVTFQRTILDSGIGASLGSEEERERELRRTVLTAAFLERHGQFPLADEELEKRWFGVPADVVRRLGEGEARRDPPHRDPAVLLVLARLLLTRNVPAETRKVDRELAARWAAAADRVAPGNAFWFRVVLAHVFVGVRDFAAAEAAVLHARRLERDLIEDAEKRGESLALWPLLSTADSRVVVGLAKDLPHLDPARVAGFARARVLGEEALDRLRDAATASAPYTEAGGTAPWPIRCDDLVRETVWDACGFTVNLENGAEKTGRFLCCGMDENEDAVPRSDALLRRALGLQGDLMNTARLHAVRGLHRGLHGDIEEALDETAEAAKTLIRLIESHPGDPDPREHHSLAIAHLNNAISLMRLEKHQDSLEIARSALTTLERARELEETTGIHLREGARPAQEDVILKVQRAVLGRLGRHAEIAPISARLAELEKARAEGGGD